jgi:hypothetical protein
MKESCSFPIKRANSTLPRPFQHQRTDPYLNTVINNKLVILRRNALLYANASSQYWALGKDTDARLWPYAVACLEAALKLSDLAVAIYAKVVEAWELPGCQKLLRRAQERWPDTKVWREKVILAYTNRDNTPEIPGLRAIYSDFEHEQDYNKLCEKVSWFVLIAFNRPEDIVNERPKIIPGPHNGQLLAAIATRSLIDHTGFEAARLHQWQHPEIERIMTVKPKPGPRSERDLRKKLTGVLTDELRFSLKADATFLELGERWYHARVLDNTVREAADFYKLDPLDLGKQIRPCDEASGYPTKK